MQLGTCEKHGDKKAATRHKFGRGKSELGVSSRSIPRQHDGVRSTHHVGRGQHGRSIIVTVVIGLASFRKLILIDGKKHEKVVSPRQSQVFLPHVYTQQIFIVIGAKP